MSDSLQPHGLYGPWNSPGQNTGVGIFPTQGLNPGLRHCRWILYHLSHQGNPSFTLSEVKLLSHVRLFVTPWTVACQTPLFMGFSRQKYWSGLPFPSPGDLPDPRIEPRSLGFTLDGFIYCSIFMQDFHLRGSQVLSP